MQGRGAVIRGPGGPGEPGGPGGHTCGPVCRRGIGGRPGIRPDGRPAAPQAPAARPRRAHLRARGIAGGRRPAVRQQQSPPRVAAAASQSGPHRVLAASGQRSKTEFAAARADRGAKRAGYSRSRALVRTGVCGPIAALAPWGTVRAL
jgi:hypothetical protein